MYRNKYINVCLPKMECKHALLASSVEESAGNTLYWRESSYCTHGDGTHGDGGGGFMVFMVHDWWSLNRKQV